MLFRCGDWCRPCWLWKTLGPSPGSTQHPLHPRNHQWENLLLPQCSGSWEPTAVRGESSSRELGGEGECPLRAGCQPEPPGLHSGHPGIYRFLIILIKPGRLKAKAGLQSRRKVTLLITSSQVLFQEPDLMPGCLLNNNTVRSCDKIYGSCICSCVCIL